MNRATTAESRPWPRALLWLLGLGTFFFASYNTANWLATRHDDVPSIVFAWERGIPFWPWSIVPYWSIDLFYAASLFVCATRRELDTHARRLLAAQVISVAIFILAPLRCTLARPDTGGLSGSMFDALQLFDKPFNQAPALHISLLVILWACYATHVPRPWRGLLHAWFALIGVSVLTTWQHHFFDVPTGAWLGLFCLWLFPGHGPSPLRTAAWTADPRRRQLALRYLLGALTAGAVAVTLGGWALWLLWGAGALLLVAGIYGLLDASAFQKDVDGRMSLAALLLLAPYLGAAWLNSRWWTRHARPASAVTPRVWIGRLPARGDALPEGVTTLVDLCAELPCHAVAAHYHNAGSLDLVAMGARELADAAQTIARAQAAGAVLVCCALGYSRSAAAIAAWALAHGQVRSVGEALALVRAARPEIVVSDAQQRTLAALASTRPHGACHD